MCTSPSIWAVAGVGSFKEVVIAFFFTSINDINFPSCCVQKAKSVKTAWCFRDGWKDNLHNVSEVNNAL